MFQAQLVKGAVECFVLSDQGSEYNLMPPVVLQRFKDAAPGIYITELNPPHIFAFKKGANRVVGS